MSTELRSALEEINTAVGIPIDELVREVEAALALAYRKAFDPPGQISVRLDSETAGIEVISTLVNEDGTETVTSLPAEDFRRLAAQTARSTVMRHIRELERDRALREVAQRRGELATGIIDRVERGVAYIDLGRAEGVMPPEEQIPGEELRVGKPIQAVILDPRPPGRQPQAQVRVSRASRLFVHRLLEAEVPEIASGAVEVRGIAREPGLRTKIAVASTKPGIDAAGACIGPKGVRHRSLLSELGGEHVDFVTWSADPAEFVAAALGPAAVVSVSLDAASRTAAVTVPRDQLSLAIGREGQNARLANKLTGWRIDIKGGDTQPDSGTRGDGPRREHDAEARA